MKIADLSEKKLNKLQKDTFSYFLKETNLENGLVPELCRYPRASLASAGTLDAANCPDSF